MFDALLEQLGADKPRVWSPAERFEQEWSSFEDMYSWKLSAWNPIERKPWNGWLVRLVENRHGFAVVARNEQSGEEVASSSAYGNLRTAVFAAYTVVQKARLKDDPDSYAAYKQWFANRKVSIDKGATRVEEQYAVK